MNPQRRGLLMGSATAAAIAAAGLPLHAATVRASDPVDVHIELRAEPALVSIRSGQPTRVWRYRGKLLSGPAGALEILEDTYLGPIIRVRRDQRVRIDFVNGLPESSIIHWHGLHVPENMDGHPRYAIAPGERYVYEFTVDNRAGTYWFHPHPHGRTGKQVYAGLAGLFLVSDDEEAGLGLPSGAQDLPLVIQDRNFDANNQFKYLGGGGGEGGMMGGGMGSMMAGMMGLLGDQILVNGRLGAKLEVGRRAHRLRLLNGSNTRTLKLAWSDGTPLSVIGTDGGLLAAPVQRGYVMLAPAERVELWVDFGHWAPGTQRVLRSLAFEGGIPSGGMMGGAGNQLPDGAAFDICRFQVGSGTATGEKRPQRLAKIALPEPRLAINAAQPKVFEVTMGMMTWGINGRSFDMLGTTAMETVKLNTQEIWEFRNDGRGSMMGMNMPHAIHVHGLQFRVLERTVSAEFSAEYASVNKGLVDDGWKDTVLLMPGERIRILLRFADHTGLFLYHCHMLEHEDSGLMRNYRVVA